MIEVARRDLDVPNAQPPLDELMVANGGTKLLEGDRKVGVLHLAREGLAQALAEAGGNTSCVEVRSSSGTLVVLDMGTGAAVLGQELMERGGPRRGHVLISHMHWDHIRGSLMGRPIARSCFERAGTV